MRDDTGRLVDEDGFPAFSTATFELLIGLMGEEMADYDGSVAPPEDLRVAVRAVPTPVLRGVLIDAAAELDRRRCGGG